MNCRLLLATLAAAALSAGIAGAQEAGEAAGVQAYAKYCAACHDQSGTRAPQRDALARLSPQRILSTLDFGLMMSIAYPMRRDEREAVARYVGKGTEEIDHPATALCSANQPILPRPAAAAWTSWSPAADNTRFQPAAGAGIAASQLGELKLKWAFGFPGDVIAFAAPTVFRGTLFVGSAGGKVHALDARSGCIHWTFRARGPVRAPPSVVEDAGRVLVLVNDQIGNLHALDARGGREIWNQRVESHESTRLTGAVVVHDGVAFVPAASWEETRAFDASYPCCTFRGSVTAVRVRDGEVVWKTWLVDPPQLTGSSPAGAAQFGPSGAGIWSAPTVDAKRGLLYVATGDNYSHPGTSTSDAIIAMELAGGKIVWTRQVTANDVFNAQCSNGGAGCGPDHDFGAPAMLVRGSGGRDILVAGQKSGMVYGLDPDQQGRILWRRRVGKGGIGGGVQWGMASDGRRVYAAVSDLVRRGGGAASGPLGNANLDPKKGGGLTALDVRTGRKSWFAPALPCVPARNGCSPAQPGALTAIAGAVFSGSMDGHLRAFSSETGKLLWDVDTQRSYQTVNGQSAEGGSLDGAGAVIADGMLFINSGYPRQGGAPGNVLLAFGLESSRP